MAPNRFLRDAAVCPEWYRQRITVFRATAVDTVSMVRLLDTLRALA